MREEQRRLEAGVLGISFCDGHIAPSYNRLKVLKEKTSEIFIDFLLRF
jgi:hypothetical protein